MKSLYISCDNNSNIAEDRSNGSLWHFIPVSSAGYENALAVQTRSFLYGALVMFRRYGLLPASTSQHAAIREINDRWESILAERGTPTQADGYPLPIREWVDQQGM